MCGVQVHALYQSHGRTFHRHPHTKHCSAHIFTIQAAVEIFGETQSETQQQQQQQWHKRTEKRVETFAQLTWDHGFSFSLFLFVPHLPSNTIALPLSSLLLHPASMSECFGKYRFKKLYVYSRINYSTKQNGYLVRFMKCHLEKWTLWIAQSIAPFYSFAFKWIKKDEHGNWIINKNFCRPSV